MKKESILDKWNKFAKKTIYINEKIEISVGRLIFCIIIMILGLFEIPIAWIVPAFSLKYKRRKKEEIEKEIE